MKNTRISHRGGRLITFFCLSWLATASAFAQSEPDYKAGILMVADTGQVLFEKNAREKVIPASVVKMMVELLVMEKMQAGELQLTDIVTVSANASKIGGQQVFLAEGETFTVEELIKAAAISSANDAVTAITEHVAGSTEAFVAMMNARAQELGMKDTKFANVHGLPPDPGQQENATTAYDIALLAREVLRYPQILVWASTLEDTFRNGTFILTNTNRDLLRSIQGMDGLKTGYHSRGAGFNVCATAKRGDLRLIAVAMGSKGKGDRSRAITSMFNLGFNQFERVTVFQKGFVVGDPVRVQRGKEHTAALVAAENVIVMVQKGQAQDVHHEVHVPMNYMVAPVEAGMRFGEAVVLIGDQPITKVDLVTGQKVEKGSLYDRVKWWVADLIW